MVRAHFPEGHGARPGFPSYRGLGANDQSRLDNSRTPRALLPCHKYMTRFVPLAAVVLAALLLAGCSSSPAPITSQGKVTVEYTDPGAGGDDLSDGSQVVVVNSSGTVIGNGTLATVSSGPGMDNIGEQDVFSFKVQVPGGLARYGIQVGGTSHGTLWETAAQMKAGPALAIDETTGGL